MKKIALVKLNLENTGGGEKVAIDMANELSKKYEVHLITPYANKENIFFEINNNVKFKSLFQKNIRIRNSIYRGSLELRKYIKQNNIELVFSIGAGMNLFTWLATINTKIKTFFCDHVSLAYNLDGSVYSIQRWIGANFFNKVITLTNEDRLNYIKKYNLNPEKVAYIYNWIEIQNYKKEQDNNTNKLITVGRINEQKGYNLLIEVAEKVLTKHKDWAWDIYGSGAQEKVKELEKNIEDKNLQDRLILKGNVKGAENIYPNHDIYVMTSYYEGLPLVLLEAQQFNLPIVSFKCPTGPSEIVKDKENGFLIDCYDVDKMSEKISELIDNKNLREQFSANSKKYMTKFEKEVIINKWVELIENL